VLRRIVPLPLAALLLLAVPASAAYESVTAGPGFEFEPADVEIDVGDTVTWQQSGPFPHNVRFDDGSFEQPADPTSTPWTAERTFDTPGTFRYYCEQHGGPNGEGMSGTVAVRDATGSVPPPAKVEPGLTVGVDDEQTLKRLVEGQGLRLRASCVNGCDITAKVSLAPRTAKRLGFAMRRVTIAKLSDTLPVDDRERLDVALKDNAAKKLADAERPFKVRLDVRASKDTREDFREKIKITP
jgi:plastocyanin